MKTNNQLSKKESLIIFNDEYNPSESISNLSKNDFLNKRKTQVLRKSGDSLKISSRGLQDWMEPLNKANGIYFLDIVDAKKYNIHFKDHETGKLMEMCFPAEMENSDEPEKGFLEKLLFDLSLFQETEPIVVFNKCSVENNLLKITEKYFEFKNDVDLIIERLVDMEQVFKESYCDSSFRDITTESIYEVLFPSQFNSFPNSNSHAMYKIFMAIQNIHLQFVGMRVAA